MKLIYFLVVLLTFYSCSQNIVYRVTEDKNSNKIADSLDAKIIANEDIPNRILVMYQDGSIEVLKGLTADEIGDTAKRGDVLFVEPDYEVHADTIYSTRQIGAYDVWTDLGYTGATIESGVTDISVAVLDTGVDTSHEDLAGKVIDEANCYSVSSSSCSSTQNDDNGHGTHVAGIVASTGAAWDSSSDTAQLEFTGYFTPPSGGNYSGIVEYFPIKILDTSSSKDLTYSLTWNSTGGSAGIQIKEISSLNTSDYLAQDSQSKTGGLGTDCSSSECITKTFTSVLDTNGSVYKGFLAIPYATSDMSSKFYLKLDIPVEKWGSETSPTQGVAPDVKLVAVKVLNSSGSGNVSDIVNGFNYLSDKLSSEHIVAANLSLSLSSGTSSAILNETIDNLIDKGLTVVASSGNSQGSSYVGSPGIVTRVITVGAVNNLNQLTNYSSVGSPDSDIIKPDVLAPGGSVSTGLGIVSDMTKYGTLSEWNKANGDNHDSYTLKTGTSQAAPHVAGAVALIADALDTWSYADDTYPRLAKMLLCMTATELGSSEDDAVDVGTPERSAVLKDRIEGYGLVDVYGAVSALSSWDYDSASVSFSFSSETYGRRSFARKIHLDSGYEYNFSLDVPAGADYDLYLFDSEPDENGEPVLLAASTLAVATEEQIIDYIPSTTKDYYIVAKRVLGSGTGTLSLKYKRTKPSTPTSISDLVIRQDINTKTVYLSWKTNVKAVSTVQYGSTAGLGEEKTDLSYSTTHSMTVYLDANPIYLRILSSSSGDSDETISTAVTKTYKVEYTTIDHNVSVSELSVDESKNKVAGCGRVDDDFNEPNGYGTFILLFPLIFLTFLSFLVSKHVKNTN